MNRNKLNIMPAVSNKCTNSKLKTTSSSSNSCIKTISSYVSNSHSSPSLSKQSTTTTTTKCPHVVLIGNVYTEDLDPHLRQQVQKQVF